LFQEKDQIEAMKEDEERQNRSEALRRQRAAVSYLFIDVLIESHILSLNKSNLLLSKKEYKWIPILTGKFCPPEKKGQENS
jgi:hypothetical protein